jgi:hypothetical protein
MQSDRMHARMPSPSRTTQRGKNTLRSKQWRALVWLLRNRK